MTPAIKALAERLAEACKGASAEDVGAALAITAAAWNCGVRTYAYDTDDAAALVSHSATGWRWIAWMPSTAVGKGEGDAATEADAMAAADAWLRARGMVLL